MFEPKIPAIGASIGFALSLLVGIFSGASFFIMLVRAIGMGVLFAVLSVVARIIILRFIPELVSLSMSETENPVDTGNVVDITIGEPEDSLFAGSDDAVLGKSVPDFFESASASASGSSFPSSEQMENNQQNEELRTDEQQGNGTSSQKFDGNKTEKTRTVGGLDVLPDLQDFIPAVYVSDSDDDVDSPPSPASTGKKDSLFTASDNMPGSNVESETLVKAIRTILAKDN